MNIIVAACNNLGIGFKDTVPWNLKKDLRYFQNITKDGVVIMGRRTYFSIPENFRPLKRRINIVLTKNKYPFPSNVLVFNNFEDALKRAKTFKKNIYVIGGEDVYKTAIIHKDIEKIYYTDIHSNFMCDRFFPTIPSTFKSINDKQDIENNIKFTYKTFQNFKN